MLWQNRQEVWRCDMTDTDALGKLLKLFFSFERPEIAGFRAAVAQFKTDLPAVLGALGALGQMIERAHAGNASFRQAEEKFLLHAQDAINMALTDADVREMLIQHILTEEIFSKVFDDSDFHQHNNVARELYALEGAFFTGALKRQTLKGLESYYAAIRSARRADCQPQRKADLFEGHLRELLQGLQRQGRRPARRGVHVQRNRALHGGRHRLAVRQVLQKEPDAHLFGSVSEENVARIKRQNSWRISMVIGNPPHHANQANENGNNKNRVYPGIDACLKQTYIAESTAQKTKLYDMYARFFRWASDRLDDKGILAFVTNRSFIESRTFDGFRKTVAQEFADIYVVDLGGDMRTNPRLSGTKHNVFGIQTGVAISFMVKRVSSSKDKNPARVHYLRHPELETAEEKLGFLANHPMRELDFDEVQPDKTGNWVNLTNNDFETLLPLASKETKAAKTAAGARR